MVRRRSTVRFRNGAPLKDQVRSSLDSSHSTLRMGAVAVLGGIWEIVFFRDDGAHLVGPRGSADRCRPHGGNRRLAAWRYKHEMIIRREHMSEPWPRTSLEDNDSQE